LIKNEIAEKIKNKRILSIDFGLKRIGLAICDPMHIVVSPYDFLLNDSNSFNLIKEIIIKENIGYLVLGFPFRLDNTETEVTKSITEFKNELEKITDLEIYLQDESYTSVNAKSLQFQIGTKKKKRREKSEKDKIAAALILQEFLKDIENY
jgi:putative Holliday junction resolvase